MNTNEKCNGCPLPIDEICAYSHFIYHGKKECPCKECFLKIICTSVCEEFIEMAEEHEQKTLYNIKGSKRQMNTKKLKTHLKDK